MSKTTLIELGLKMRSEVIIGYFRSQGFVFDRSTSHIVELGSCQYLEITQNGDDTANGLGDFDLYSARMNRIEKQAARKRKEGWSETKIQNWLNHKLREEILPIEKGALKWLAMLEGLLDACMQPTIVLVISINNMELNHRVFASEQKLSLQKLEPINLVLLKHDRKYAVGR